MLAAPTQQNNLKNIDSAKVQRLEAKPKRSIKSSVLVAQLAKCSSRKHCGPSSIPRTHVKRQVAVSPV